MGIISCAAKGLAAAILFVCAATGAFSRSQAQAATLLTFYCPDVDDDMEGGRYTMLGSRIVTFEESAQNGHIPTLASWVGFAAGQCNNRPGASTTAPRCVVAITVPGVSRVPGYAAHVAKFKGQHSAICESCDTILGVVEDTGGLFNGQDKQNPQRMFDLAMTNRSACNAGIPVNSSKLKWKVVGYVSGASRPNRPLHKGEALTDRDEVVEFDPEPGPENE